MERYRRAKKFEHGLAGSWILRLAALVLLLYSSSALAEMISLRHGTTAATSTEKIILALAKDAGILKQHDLAVEVG